MALSHYETSILVNPSNLSIFSHPFDGIRFVTIMIMKDLLIQKKEKMAPERYSVLIVEDEPTSSRLMEFVLTNSRETLFEVTCVNSAEEGLSRFEAGEEYDVVLLDYYLPGKNGAEFLHELRKITIDPAIICISITQEYKIAIDVLKAGADDFLCKIELDKNRVLERSIAAVLKKREYRKQIAETEISDERLDAISTVIRTVQHELNNPMTILNLLASVLSSGDTLSPETLRNYSAEISRTVQRMNEVLHKLHVLEREVVNRHIKGPKIFSISQ